MVNDRLSQSTCTVCQVISSSSTVHAEHGSTVHDGAAAAAAAVIDLSTSGSVYQ